MSSSDQKPIYVTKSFIPPIEEYQKNVDRAFKKEWLTNRGELVLELEHKLQDYLGVNQITLHTNGTLPIQIALKALGIHKEVITTPFSYVATTSAIIWEGAKPVFADIDEEHWTIDPKRIEEKITENTQAILATHVFGNPCDIETIEEIALKHGLIVIYDAAHSFGVNYKGESLFNYGHVSTCSFHATKLFHTAEGGASFCNDEKLKHQLFYHHNFGHNGAEEFHGLGINSKMSELQAAMGLTVLPHMEMILSKREAVSKRYEELLSNVEITFIKWRKGATRNYSYFPVLFPSHQIMTQVKEALEKNKIFPRRYFYPSLNKLPYLDHLVTMPVAEDIADRILCLPLSHNISGFDVDRIIEIIIKEML
ncbi:MAG: DegT/DnrJ/EryC1/StrS family aminotransferase [Nonlabens ulvanivorans]|uniref:DegT/DnrJ/EryC1/StrS family aminotransferase n=2 Tax=Nonlabens ulvanivorans TaxID=906888 RepID=UPI0032656F3A